jgi:hypothetical protein
MISESMVRSEQSLTAALLQAPGVGDTESMFVVSFLIPSCFFVPFVEENLHEMS